MKQATPNEQELISSILRFKYDPEGFVRYVFPWGKKNSPLERFSGPRTWQLELLREIQDKLLSNREKLSRGENSDVIYIAISSGRGIGKSAMLSMLSCWFMSCWLGGTNIVTANSETQLRSRTLAELGKWNQMAINNHWFEKASMSLRPAKWFAELLNTQLQMDTQYYYTEGQAWSKENPDAFAGAHSQIGMMVQYDEASGIDDSIWDVTEGFFTDTAELRLWVTISNPRRNTGRFFDCFHKDAHMWSTRCIDSRTVEGVDKAVYQRIADKYGEDHDTTRMEVKGEFPRVGSNQFIGRDTVHDAMVRDCQEDNGAPLLMGVDVARYGDDQSVIFFRQGRDARTREVITFRKTDTMQLASEVANAIDRYNPHAVFIDGGGVGGGVVDRVKQLGYSVTEVQSGEKAGDPEKYLNKRVEMWAEMRDWLVYGCLRNDADLVDDLTGPEYEINIKGQIKLESKDSMKKRGLKSPDYADALALTFAQPIARVDTNLRKRRSRWHNKVADTDYDIYGD